MDNTIQNTKIDELSLDIIELLSKYPFESFTVEKIRESIPKQNYATVYRKIELLVGQEILNKSMYGMASRIRINLDSPKTISVLSLIEAKKFEKFFNKLKGNLFTSMNEIIKDTANLPEFVCIIIFGSYAKGTETKSSDLDMLIIYTLPALRELLPEQYSKYNEDIKHSMMGILKTSELKGGPKINPIIVGNGEHEDMILDKDINVAKETLLNHIILKGFSEYWREIANCQKNVIKS